MKQAPTEMFYIYVTLSILRVISSQSTTASHINGTDALQMIHNLFVQIEDDTIIDRWIYVFGQCPST